MSRARLSYILAFLGILITTGGCANSATAPEAASVEVSQNRSKNPTSRDSVVTTPSANDDGATVAGGVILVGGERY
ncbi:MAG TPA: hypothetical protein VGX50_00845 [Longimicrobium sp.]|jgi:uncharacterized membrane protein|nr:hypothetical protein [Longimicrobium sp.]